MSVSPGTGIPNANPISGTGITSINGDTAAAQTIAGQTDKILVSDITPVHTITLGSDVVTIDQANVYEDFDQTFQDNRLRIERPAGGGVVYIFTAAAIAANKVINLPLLTGPDTLVTEAFAQTLTNKIINAANNTITGIGSSEIIPDIISGLTEELSPAALDFILGFTPEAGGNLRKFDVGNLPGGGGEFTGAWTADHNQTGSGFSLVDARFSDPGDSTKEVLMDLSGNATGIVLTIATLQSTAQTLQIPNTTALDQFVLEDFAQTLTNKTIAAGSNTISGLTIGAEVTGASTDLTDTGVIVRTNQLNDFGDFDQTFLDNRFLIERPAGGGINYTFQAAAIAAARIITLPLLLTGDTMVTEAFSQTLTNKVIDSANNTITNIVNADISATALIVESKLSVAVGVAGTILTSNGVGVAPTYQSSSGGEFTGAWTANHNTGGSTFSLEDAKFSDPVDNTKTIQWDLSAIGTGIELTIASLQSTAQILQIPNTTGTDQFVLEDFAQTLTNKTITAAANSLTIASTDLTDTALIVLNNQANTYSGGGTQDFAGATLDNVSALISNTALPASVGTIRLANTDTMGLRNAADNFDFLLGMTTNNMLQLQVEEASEQGHQLNTAIGKSRWITSNTATSFMAGFQSFSLGSSKPLLAAMFIDGAVATAHDTSGKYAIVVRGYKDPEVAPANLANMGIFSVGGIGDNQYLSIQANGDVSMRFGKKFFFDGSVFGIGDNTSISRQQIDNLVVEVDNINGTLAATNFDTTTISQTSHVMGENTKIQINSDGIGSFGSGISFSQYNEVAANAFENKWALVRETNATGDLLVTFGTSVQDHINPEIFRFEVGGGATSFGDINLSDNNLTSAGLIELNNPANTFQYIFTGAAIAGDIVVTLPLLTIADTLVTEAFTQTSANKTIDLDSNTITGTVAEFNAATSLY